MAALLVGFFGTGCGEDDGSSFDGSVGDRQPGDDLMDSADSTGPDVPGGDLDDCLTGLPMRTDLRVLKLASMDDSIRIAFATGAPADFCTGMFCACNGGTCRSYELLAFGISRGGVSTCVTTPSALGYQGGHHAWAGTATVTTATDVYRVGSQLDFVTQLWSDELTISDPGSATPREGPLPLVASDCYAVPPGGASGCCESCANRPRSDL